MDRSKSALKRARFLGREAVKSIIFIEKAQDPRLSQISSRIAEADAIQAGSAAREFLEEGGIPPQRLTPEQRALMRRQVEELIDRGWCPIGPTKSLRAKPITHLPKAAAKVKAAREEEAPSNVSTSGIVDDLGLRQILDGAKVMGTEGQRRETFSSTPIKGAHSFPVEPASTMEAVYLKIYPLAVSGPMGSNPVDNLIQVVIAIKKIRASQRRRHGQG